MELKAGDIVINPAMPNWGPGEVISTSDGKALVRFKHNVIRKMAVSFLALAETGECFEPSKKQNTSPAAAPAPSGDAGGLIAQAMAMMQSEASISDQKDDALASGERSAGTGFPPLSGW